MFPRLLVTIVCIAVIGATLLALRQQRLSMMHAMAQLHIRMDHDRKATWKAQSHIAEAIHPPALKAAVARIGLELEPLPARDPQALPSPAHMPYQNRIAQLGDFPREQ